MGIIEESIIKLGNNFFKLEVEDRFSQQDLVEIAEIKSENRFEDFIIKFDNRICKLLYFIFEIYSKIVNLIIKPKKFPERADLELQIHEVNRKRLLSILEETELELQSSEVRNYTLNISNKVKSRLFKTQQYLLKLQQPYAYRTLRAYRKLCQHLSSYLPRHKPI